MIALPILASLALSSPLPRTPVQRTSPAVFRRESDSGPRGAVRVSFALDEYARFRERHARGDVFLLRELPLPGGEQADVELCPVDALEPGARAQVVLTDGAVSLLAPEVRCFSGHVLGGGPAFLAVSRGAVQGYFTRGEELYTLSPGASARPGRATLSHADSLGDLASPGCGLPAGAAEPAEYPVEALKAVTPVLRTAEVFIEADNVFRSRFASDQECVDYCALLVSAASEIYRRDIGTRLVIPDGYLRVWNKTPPWGVITGFSSLKKVYDWWQSAANPLRSIPRAAVHVFTNPVFGGTSRGVDGLCSTVRAYEISSLTGKFPFPVVHSDRGNWDLFVVCHEFGHTFGSPHSNLYTPPIECVDGSGPDSGTLMSYCHTTYGIARLGMRFHLREQQRIRLASADAPCWKAQPLLPGDYDGDGVLEATDFSALEGVLTQGFRSLGAEEVFDLDANGVLDDADHDLLAQLVFRAPPAQVVSRNGSGLNPACLESLDTPLLGATWHTRIAAAGVGTTTLLVGYDAPLGGYPTTRGELLVKTTAFGGTKLFSSTAPSDGLYARHALPLPLDAALFGRTVSFQGLIVNGPAGEQYCNALDVVLSPYE